MANIGCVWAHEGFASAKWGFCVGTMAAMGWRIGVVRERIGAEVEAILAFANAMLAALQRQP